MRDFLKRQALRYLPTPLLQRLKLRHYAAALRSSRAEDEPDLLVVRHLAAEGSTTVDLGANVGVYTKALSEYVGTAGRVVSVEPIPPTFEILASNVRTLGLSNVQTVNAAVSDAVGRVSMEVPAWKTGGDNFYEARIVPANGAAASGTATRDGARYDVAATTVDALLAAGSRVGAGAGAGADERITFIKCDVEGHEEACLRGAAGVIARHHPAWLIEVWGDPDADGTSAHRTFGILGDASYSAWIFDGRRLSRREPGRRATNYFFLTEMHVASIPSALR